MRSALGLATKSLSELDETKSRRAGQLVLTLSRTLWNTLRAFAAGDSNCPVTKRFEI